MTYGYDSLNRLISAQSGSTWGETFSYDGFGNLTTKQSMPNMSQGVPALSVGVYPANNQIIGQSYDANGNMLSSPAGQTLAYDVENRLAQAYVNNAGMFYGYDGSNKRVWSCAQSAGICSTGTFYFYGPNGKLLSVLTATYTGANGTSGPKLTVSGAIRQYFGSRLLGNEDRLSSRGRYYPYGEDRDSNLTTKNPGDGQVTFATYTRDSATGLNYADQRYYATGWGRFVSPDPYKASHTGNDPATPQKWNRYAYVTSDPVNWYDPKGLAELGPDKGDDGDPGETPVPECEHSAGCDGDRPGGGEGGGGAGQTSSYVPDPAKTLADENAALAVIQSGGWWETSGNCQKDLDALGVEGSQIVAAALNTQIKLSTSSDVIPNTGGETVSQYFANANQQGRYPLAITPIGGNNIYFTPGASDPLYLDTLPAYQGASGAGGWWSPEWNLGNMVHELLHTLGFTDQGITTPLLGNPSANSGQISTKLAQDCFGAK